MAFFSRNNAVEEQVVALQRDRIQNDDTAPSLDSVNDDCLLLILSYLSTEDLNTVTLCNERFRQARNHESLDQTRTATIVLTERSTVESLFFKITHHGWNNTLERNHYTRMNIDGFDRLEFVHQPFQRAQDEEEFRHNQAAMARAAYGRMEQASVGSQLTGITSLVMSCTHITQVHVSLVEPLTRIFPNLRHVNLDSLRVQNAEAGGVCQDLVTHCPHLERLSWNGGYRVGQWMSGGWFENGTQLRELHLDGANFHVRGARFMRSFADMTSDDQEQYFFMQCRSLERLSFRNATWNIFRRETLWAVSQEALIKMVRLHPTLRWLRSDLTAEHIAMLQQERPEITLVN